MKLKNIKDFDYYEIVYDIINNEIVLKMNNYIQHGITTTLEHSVNVSYLSYKISKKLKLDYKSVARGALLHDFFLYDWHKEKIGKYIFDRHGFVHPKIALSNAKKYFKLNRIEKNIILSHMWPLTILTLPRYKESLLVSLIDKYVSIKEIVQSLFYKEHSYT